MVVVPTCWTGAGGDDGNGSTGQARGVNFVRGRVHGLGDSAGAVGDGESGGLEQMLVVILVLRRAERPLDAEPTYRCYRVGRS